MKCIEMLQMLIIIPDAHVDEFKSSHWWCAIYSPFKTQLNALIHCRSAARECIRMCKSSYIVDKFGIFCSCSWPSVNLSGSTARFETDRHDRRENLIFHEICVDVHQKFPLIEMDTEWSSNLVLGQNSAVYRGLRALNAYDITNHYLHNWRKYDRRK